MANQQLVDYIKGQLQAGVKDEDIKKILKDAGWPDSEVLDGMATAKGPAISSPIAQPTVSSSPTSQVSTQSGSGSPSAMKINAFGGSISSGASAFSSSPKTEDKKESVKFDFVNTSTGAKSSGETATFKPQETKTESFSPVENSVLATEPVTNSSKKNLLPWILFAIILIASAVVIPMLYMNNLSVNESKISLETQLQTVNSQLMSLQGVGADAETQLSALNSEKQDILDEIAIFATPVMVPASDSASTTGTSTQPAMQMPSSVEFRVKGSVAQDPKGVYIITTPRNIILTVKNSKDAKLAEVLSPLVGQEMPISFSGVHAPMSKDLTVESVNGVSIK